MKKMFITGMNKTKTYVEPEMRVIEVDSSCLCDPSGSDATGGSGDLGDGDNADMDDDLFGNVKLFNFDVWDQ